MLVNMGEIMHAVNKRKEIKKYVGNHAENAVSDAQQKHKA